MSSFKHTIVSILLLALAVGANAGMYSEHVVELTASNFDKMVMDSAETWLVKFYAPWCGHCKSSAPAFSKAAKKLRGVARLGVINCDNEKNMAQRFGVNGFPTIKVFKGEGRKARRPSDYNSQRTSQGFVDHVKYVMPSFVARVKPTGTEAFFSDLSTLPHVLLFTEQTSTSPLYKGMSARFKNRLSFGEVRKSDASQLMAKYEVASFPTLIAFQPGKSDAESLVRFSGNMDPSSLDTFFANIASGKPTQPESGGESTETKDASEKVFAQPKAYSGDVVTIAGTTQYEELCAARKDGRMCALTFAINGEESPQHDMLKPIALKYQYDNMAFAIMDGSLDEVTKFAALFDVKASSGFVVIRARKNKFTAMGQDTDLSDDSVAAFLDKVVGGDARWKKVSGDLPEWVVEQAEEDSDAGANADGSADGDADNAGGGSAEGNDTGGQCGGPAEPEEGGSCGGPGTHEDL